jgi:hypothetical protein
MQEIVFLYWASTKDNEEVHFMSDNYYEIGDVVDYQGEMVTITHMAEEVYDEDPDEDF